MNNLIAVDNVEPSIFHGLFNNIWFEPWTEFQTIMSEGMQTLSQIEKDKSLNTVRRSSNKSELLESHDVTPKRSSPVLRDTSTPGIDKEHIPCLLLNETDFVCRWIEAAYPRTTAKIGKDIISSEHIFCNASKDMIHRFMRKLVKKENNAGKDQDRECSSYSQSPDSKSIPLKPVIPLTQAADQWVFRYSQDEPTSIPIYCYQFEDRTEDITGILPFYRNVRPSDSDSSESLVDLEIEIPVRSQRDMYISGASPEQVAAHFNTLFSLNNDTSEEEELEHSSGRLVISIAQAISRAILTKTGCTYLANHKMALALQVKEDPNSETFGAKVLVTGALKPNKKLGRSDAILGLTRYCFEQDMKLQDDQLLDPMRRLILGFSYNTYNSIDRIVPLPSSWRPGERYPSFRNRASTTTIRNAGEDEGDASDGVQNLETTNLVHPNEDKLLMRLFGSTEGLLAVGYSGVVVRGMLEGEAVAIKTWNERDLPGFLDLRREIGVYKHIKQKCPAILGSAVPTFKIGWDRPDVISVYHKQPVLVTGLMGTEISKLETTIRVVDGDRCVSVTTEERHQICASAMKSLKQLHDNGFQHGDIAFRNMRVARNKDCDKTWKVWWIDLGRAFHKESFASHFKAREMKACKNLFNS